MRTPAAVERRAVHGQRDAGGLVTSGQRGDACFVDAPDEAGAQRREQLVGVDRPAAGDQRRTVLVVAADDGGALVPRVQGAPDEHLERRVLLLDDEHFAEPVGELADLLVVERHRHRQSHQADAVAAQRLVVGEPEQAERFAHLVVRVAGSGDADPVVLGADGDLVEPVEHAVLAGQHGADLLELPLHLERVRRQQAATRTRHEQLAIDFDRRDRRHDAVGVNVDGAGAVGDGGDELVADPHAARPREGDGVTGEIERFLHVAREDDRHVQVDQGGVARAGECRRLGGGVVADDRDDASPR